jgi:hypothetical protein
VPHAPYDYRADPAVLHFADDRPIIIFDGKCVVDGIETEVLVKRGSKRCLRGEETEPAVAVCPQDKAREGGAQNEPTFYWPTAKSSSNRRARGEFWRSSLRHGLLSPLPAGWFHVHCATVCTILSRAIACNGLASARPAICPTRRMPIALLPDGDGHRTARGESLDLCPHLASSSAALCNSSISTRIFSV